MIKENTATLAIRTNPGNPNHHLWNNNGTWYIHYTLYPDAYTAQRIRRSLNTRQLEEARARRDQIFETFSPPLSGRPTLPAETGP